MKQKYKEVNFSAARLQLITIINQLILDYQAQGFRLTVRQLYYQLVARDLIPNDVNSYKRIVDTLTDARLDGLIDWDAIEDRTREISIRAHWADGGEILLSAARSFYMDRWVNQDHRVFVVVEKEALFGVLEGVCRQNDVPLLAARGYPSVTVLRQLVVDFFLPAVRTGQAIHMLHLGDHDPSGIHMTEDLEERISMFMGDKAPEFEIHRLALNLDQITRYNPPPNPAKSTDSRFKKYKERFGGDSWELDALEPRILVDLVQKNIDVFKDETMWEVSGAEIEEVKTRLRKVADDF